MTAPGNWPPRSEAEYRQEVAKRIGSDLAAVFGRIQLMVFDCDGVLTTGNLIYGPDGEALKEFHSHDGLGLMLARAVGIKRAVLTGRDSPIVQRRCNELRFDSIKLGRFDKIAALREILQETGCVAAETLYMGDDLIDLPPLQEAGLAVTVPSAPLELREFCDYTTEAEGGQGAVREITDLVLKSSGLYGSALVRLLEGASGPGGDGRTQ